MQGIFRTSLGPVRFEVLSWGDEDGDGTRVRYISGRENVSHLSIDEVRIRDKGSHGWWIILIPYDAEYGCFEYPIEVIELMGSGAYPRDGWYWVESIKSGRVFLAWVETYVDSDEYTDTRILTGDDFVRFDADKYRLASGRLLAPVPFAV